MVLIIIGILILMYHKISTDYAMPATSPVLVTDELIISTPSKTEKLDNLLDSPDTISATSPLLPQSQTLRTSNQFSKRCPGEMAYGCTNGKAKHLSKVLIIGVTKSGTTALEWFLLLHEQIKSGIGEPHFFDWNYDLGVKWYCRKMPCTTDNVMVLERTPRYYVHLSQKNVHDFDPNMKLLLIVREPVDRMVSHLVHNYGYRDWKFYKKVVLDPNTLNANESAKQIFQSQYFK